MCGQETRTGKDFHFHVAKFWTTEEKVFRLCQIDAWASEHEEGFRVKVSSRIQEVLNS